jgi:anti-anti-sigma regulatory factor
VLRRWRGEHRRLWEGYDENIIPRPPPEPAVPCAPVLWGGGCTGREPDTRMAFFSKPPTRKKPEPAKVDVRSRAGSGGVDGRAASARELAAHAADRGGRRHVEPAGDDLTVTGASLVQWTPAQSSFEVAQANPGLCAVLENAALRYAGGQTADARRQLEEGIENDSDTKLSVLAWLALFDVLQRQGDKAAFDRLALQYVVQFERSAPAWEAGEKPGPARRVFGGTVAVTGRLTAASATQIEGIRRAISRQSHGARLDLASVTDFDDDGARLLARALADARRAGLGMRLQAGTKLAGALAAAMKAGRDAGEGAWLLSLEILQWADDRAAFEDRAIEFAVAFELSPPSWEASPVLPGAGPDETVAMASSAVDASEPEALKWSGVMAGALAPQLGRLADATHAQQVIPVDMSEVERIDFVCAGALLNLINRIEAQRKAVQIVGASPIIRALLLLIGVSPRHFVKKAQ